VRHAFQGLDLNLLIALDVLLEEQSVSRAATRLHLSQPAVSAALRRLRTFFGDPILAIDGKRMTPTAHALRLRPLLKELFGDVDAMLSISPHFDPATSTRRFRICASDFVFSAILYDLFQQLEVVAPSLQFEIVQTSDETLRMLELGEIDLLIIPETNASHDHPSEFLFAERHVVAGWRDNPVMAGPMTAAQFADAGHISVQIGRLSRASFAESHLRAVGIERKVELLVTAFGLVPDLLLNTGRLAIMHERLARHAAKSLPITYRDLPFEMPIMREVVQYHRTRADDSGLRWLIDELSRVIAAADARALALA